MTFTFCVVCERDTRIPPFHRATRSPASRLPPITGLDTVDYLTNRNLFDLVTLPESLAVVGGGAIGAEIAQALAMLGVHVSLIEMKDRILPQEDRETSAVLEQALRRNGIAIYTGTRLVGVTPDGAQAVLALEDKAQRQSSITVRRIFVATGRAPNVDGLGLDRAGVQYSPRGILTDATLQTSAPHIYACGDATGPYKFTHMAGYQAGIAMANILQDVHRSVDYAAVPWCIYTAPELAHFGPTEDEARERYGTVHVYKAEYRENDRAITDGEDTGLAKVICDDAGHILGAHVVGANAGEIIHEYILARAAGLTLGDIGAAVHIYPTIARIVKATSEQFRIKERLKEREKEAVT
jgi:pyruvate/2-oxoglutarate dehydrogenase complex dihydrolipoamide dehydrogenase (E3) component